MKNRAIIHKDDHNGFGRYAHTGFHYVINFCYIDKTGIYYTTLLVSELDQYINMCDIEKDEFLLHSIENGNVNSTMKITNDGNLSKWYPEWIPRIREYKIKQIIN